MCNARKALEHAQESVHVKSMLSLLGFTKVTKVREVGICSRSQVQQPRPAHAYLWRRHVSDAALLHTWVYCVIGRGQNGSLIPLHGHWDELSFCQ